MFPTSDYRLLLQFLLAVAAIATGSCTQTQPARVSPSPQSATPTKAPKSSLESNPFDSVVFPQDSCGDPKPDNPNTGTIEFYPVFIEYSERNLQAVRSKFCRDSFLKDRKNLGIKSIQVASFRSRERASEFKELMQREFGSGEIGDVKIVEVEQNLGTAKERGSEQESELLSIKEKSSAAQIPQDYVNKLLSINNSNNRDKINFKVVIPTYIPSGFKVKQIEVVNHEQYGVKYSILYQNTNKSCFELKADNGQWGGPALGWNTVEVVSPDLGSIVIEHTNSDALDNASIIFRKDKPASNVRKKTAYSFSSVGGNTHWIKSYNCQTAISIQEAVKIVESLQYLSP